MLFSAVECFGLSDLVDTYNRVPQYRTLFKTMLAVRPEKAASLSYGFPQAATAGYSDAAAHGAWHG
jgi:hypothetical protein